MDIEYLLWLQGLRESWGANAEFIATLITNIPKSPLSALIPGILFWCINKRAGVFLLMVAAFGRLLNVLIKDTACVYRPWVLDSAVQPATEALEKASSYSMPSGHTQGVMAIYGGLAYFYRRKFPRLIIPCAMIILAVGFSRNFLGVHTPQDVLVAIIETFAVMFIAEKILDASAKDKKYTVMAFAAGIIFSVAAALFIMLKSYPMDYLNGQVIVSPLRAVIDSLDSIGGVAGFLIGLPLENHFVNFTTNVDRATKMRRIIIGGVVGGAAMTLLYALKVFSNIAIYEFCKGFLPLIAIIFLAPLAFSFVEKRVKFRR